MLGHSFSGLPQFQKTIRDLSLSKQKAVKVAILKRAAEPMRETAERLVPISKDAPHLVDNIFIQVLSRVDDEEFGGKRATEADEAVIAVGPSRDLFYSSFQEFGTVHHAAQPFMRPAFDENRERAVKSIQDDIWAHIRKTAERSGSGRTT